MEKKYVDEAVLDELIEQLRSEIPSFERVCPVGSVYVSTSNTHLSTLFGFGTWAAINDVFLLSAGSTYSAGSTGGSKTHSHTSAAHTHTIAGHTHTVAGHTHTTAGHTLTIAEMPAHIHTNLYASSGASDSTWGYDYTNNGGKRSSATEASGGIGSVGGGGSHSHGNTGSTSPTSLTTNATSVTTDSTTPSATGSSSTLPPYLVVYMWRRTK